MSVAQALEVSVIGIAVVFAVLAALMAVLSIMSRLLGSVMPGVKKSSAASDTERGLTTSGISGAVSLYGVQEETAAIIIAVVSDSIGGDARILSIRESSDEV